MSSLIDCSDLFKDSSLSILDTVTISIKSTYNLNVELHLPHNLLLSTVFLLNTNLAKSVSSEAIRRSLNSVMGRPGHHEKPQLTALTTVAFKNYLNTGASVSALRAFVVVTIGAEAMPSSRGLTI